MRKRGQKFRDLPMAERFTQMEEAYARATVALTRARSVCIIFGPLDMKGLMGAAVAIQCPTSKPGMTLERFSWQACIRWARRSHRDRLFPPPKKVPQTATPPKVVGTLKSGLPVFPSCRPNRAGLSRQQSAKTRPLEHEQNSSSWAEFAVPTAPGNFFFNCKSCA